TPKRTNLSLILLCFKSGSVSGGRFGSSTCFNGFGASRLSMGSKPSSISLEISNSIPLSGSNKSSSFCFCTLISSLRFRSFCYRYKFTLPKLIFAGVLLGLRRLVLKNFVSVNRCGIDSINSRALSKSVVSSPMSNEYLTIQQLYHQVLKSNHLLHQHHQPVLFRNLEVPHIRLRHPYLTSPIVNCLSSKLIELPRSSIAKLFPGLNNSAGTSNDVSTLVSGGSNNTPLSLTSSRNFGSNLASIGSADIPFKVSLNSGRLSASFLITVNRLNISIVILSEANISADLRSSKTSISTEATSFSPNALARPTASDNKRLNCSLLFSSFSATSYATSIDGSVLTSTAGSSAGTCLPMLIPANDIVIPGIKVVSLLVSTILPGINSFFSFSTTVIPGIKDDPTQTPGTNSQSLLLFKTLCPVNISSIAHELISGKITGSLLKLFIKGFIGDITEIIASLSFSLSSNIFLLQSSLMVFFCLGLFRNPSPSINVTPDISISLISNSTVFPLRNFRSTVSLISDIMTSLTSPSLTAFSKLVGNTRLHLRLSTAYTYLRSSVHFVFNTSDNSEHPSIIGNTYRYPFITTCLGSDFFFFRPTNT
ncbi:hypothetical protein AGLY_003206, partial [Aphis glycines]